MTTIYRDATASLAELDARDPAYRYDLDADIRWDQIDAPGCYAPDSFLRLIGVDVEAVRACEAMDLVQWLFALMVCEEFAGLERVVIQWTRNAELVPSESVVWLRDEEVKHIKTFRRFRKHLLAARPEIAERVQELMPKIHPAAELEPTDDVNEVGIHYLTWLEILAFEEYTVLFSQALMAETEVTIQPAWLDVHRCHADEELCHIATDVGYLEALDMSDEERFVRSKHSVTWMMARNTQAFRTPVRMLLALKPELEGKISEGKPPTGFMKALFTSPTFQLTRDCAPYLAWLAKQQTPGQSS
jgi:predicted metal-dependent hydrolase